MVLAFDLFISNNELIINKLEKMNEIRLSIARVINYLIISLFTYLVGCFPSLGYEVCRI